MDGRLTTTEIETTRTFHKTEKKNYELSLIFKKTTGTIYVETYGLAYVSIKY